jgi:hypothetical protein
MFLLFIIKLNIQETPIQSPKSIARQKRREEDEMKLTHMAAKYMVAICTVVITCPVEKTQKMLKLAESFSKIPEKWPVGGPSTLGIKIFSETDLESKEKKRIFSKVVILKEKESTTEETIVSDFGFLRFTQEKNPKCFIGSQMEYVKDNGDGFLLRMRLMPTISLRGEFFSEEIEPSFKWSTVLHVLKNNDDKTINDTVKEYEGWIEKRNGDCAFFDYFPGDLPTKTFFVTMSDFLHAWDGIMERINRFMICGHSVYRDHLEDWNNLHLTNNDFVIDLRKFGVY